MPGKVILTARLRSNAACLALRQGRQRIAAWTMLPGAFDRNGCYNLIREHIIRDQMSMTYPAGVETTFGFLLKDVSRLHVKRFEQRAGLLGLTLPECRVLLYLSYEEGATQVRLAATTDIEPMTLVRMLDRMEADGWLERRSNPTDRRTRHLYFKAKGKALLDEIRQLIDLTRAEALSGITQKNVDLLMKLLEKTRANLLALAPIDLPPDAPRRAASARRKVSA